MKPAFQADNDLDQTVLKAIWQVEPTLDFNPASEMNRHGLDDLTVLELAALEKRILVSSDQKTMPRNFAEFIQNQTSYGAITAKQSLPLNVVAEEILLIWRHNKIEDWINLIAYLPL
jgi:hypothetical protein